LKLSDFKINYFIAGAIGAIILMMFQPFLVEVVVFAFFLILFLLIQKKREVVLVFVIASSLVLTRSIDPTLRLVIQLLNYLLLSIIFFRQYEFHFQNYPRFPKIIVVYLGLLVFLMLISALHSPYLYLGISQIGRTILFFYLIYLLFAFITNEKIIKNYLLGLFLVAMIYLSFLIYEFVQFNYDLLAFNISGTEANGNSYLHKNALGSFFVLSLLLLISFLFNNKYLRYRKWIIIFVAIFTSGLIITNARAALIALFFGVVFLLYYLRRSYLKYFSTIILTLSCLYFLLPTQKYVDMYFRLERISTGRDFILSSMWNVIKSNWLFGSGPAGSKYEMYKEIPYMLGSMEELYLRHHYDQIEFGHAHNFYLFFLSDLGIFGFILSLALPFIFLKISLQTISLLQKEKGENYYLALGITAFGIAMFVRGIFEWAGILSYGTIGYDLPFWILFSIQLFLNQKYKTKENFS